MVAGIHHITLITRRVQANVDFYVGFLGLRLVKRTGGFEDAGQLHLFYGDAAGSPGSLITFLVWEDGSPGRPGIGQVGEVSLAIDPAAIGFWLTRALRFGLKIEGPQEEFGEPVLRLKDPDGVILKLVGTAGLVSAAPWPTDGIPAEHAIRRIRGATLFTEIPGETRDLLERHFYYRPLSATATISRLVSSSGDIIDVRDAGGFWASAPGTGTVDHVAFRAADDAELEAVRSGLQQAGSWPTAMHDRKYFRSLYVREPGRILLELATDAPGMDIDENEASLGTHLFVPGEDPRRRDAMTVILPQFSMPGEPRVVYRDLPFVHRIHTPDDPDGSVLILLHGSGANETSLLPLAREAAPRATLIGVRGRASEEGSPRWFRRMTADIFDQVDIAGEAEAFAAFVDGAIQSYDIDRDRLIFLGYSNGANFLGAILSLHPHLVRRAILLRPIPVLDNPARTDMADADILLVSGRTDADDGKTPALLKLLGDGAATVRHETVPHGHDLADDDTMLIRTWLEERAGHSV